MMVLIEFSGPVIDAASNIVRWLTDITLNQEQMHICVKCIIWELPLLFILAWHEFIYSHSDCTLCTVSKADEQDQTREAEVWENQTPAF